MLRYRLKKAFIKHFIVIKNRIFFLLQSILRYFPFQLGIFLRRVLYKPFFKKFGKNIKIFDAVVIKYPDEIELGDTLTINQFCYIVGKGGLSIGDNVLMGAGTKITTSKHNFQNSEVPIAQQGIGYDSIFIAGDVWFGFNTVVLGGSYIGEGCVLAANCVVNSKRFEAYSIIGGVPAKEIGKRK